MWRSPTGGKPSAGAWKNAQEGDIIVLAGKGHEDYQEIQGEKRPFDERVVIRELLEEMGTPQPQAAP